MTAGPGVTVIVLTHNEAAQIEACLGTLRWAEELIVVDSGSTDGTVEIARAIASRVEVWAPYPGYARQRNRALDLASREWVFCVDADERCPPTLAEEIRATIARPDAADAYVVALRTFFLDRWLRSDWWWPQYHPRLFRRGAARWEEREVHPPVITKGREERLAGALEHYPYPTVSAFAEKLDRYTTWEARERMKRPESVSPLPPVWSVLRPPMHFWRLYVVRRGFRDGWPGLLVSGLASVYPLLADWKAWRLARTR